MSNRLVNLILDTDSYKFSQFVQYPPGTEIVNSYIEARGPSDFSDEVVVLGVIPWIRQHLDQPITRADIEYAAWFCEKHGVPFNRDGWEYILEAHRGRVPVTIEAVPEGTVVPVGNVIVQIRNTDERCAWVVSYLETSLLRHVWYMSTVASLSRAIKKRMKGYLDRTSDNPDHLDFMLHDFGSRGVSSQESAAMGGAAHLVNFKGTDTVPGLIYAMENYNSPGMVGYSIPASEHSTITSWSRDGEIDAYRNMVDQFAKSNPIFACVCDSWDVYAAVEMWHSQGLFDRVKEAGSRIVIRPDSGDLMVPVKVIEQIMALEGHTVNSKGFKVLPNHIRVIQGDGVNYHTIGYILAEMQRRGLAADNITFGMGGALLQGVNRDTFKFAMKASAIRINGEWRDVYKDPVTDPGKRPKRGVLTLNSFPDGTYKTERAVRVDSTHGLLLPPIMGTIFEHVRARAAVGI